MNKSAVRWLAKLEWHLDRLATLKENPDPRFQRMCATAIPKYEGYRQSFEKTGQIDSEMYEMVMGNM